MKIIRVDNYTYYLALIGSIVCVFATVLIFTRNLYVETFFCACLTISFVYFFLKSKKYRLELSKGLIKEVTLDTSSEIRFSTITQLDCKEIKSGDSKSLHAVFLVQTKNGLVEFETKLQASLFDIALWVRDNYPSAIFTKTLNKYLSVPRSKMFFGSKNNYP